MRTLDISLDELLMTTWSVRKRLDLSRGIEPEIIRECLEIAVQAPTGSNLQNWHFVVVTGQQKRAALGAIYRKGFARYRELVASSSVEYGTQLHPGACRQLVKILV